jgi:hypothetical protein
LAKPDDDYRQPAALWITGLRGAGGGREVNHQSAPWAFWMLPRPTLFELAKYSLLKLFKWLAAKRSV